jgi:chemotaxis methyl-accepting protein methylase
VRTEDNNDEEICINLIIVIIIILQSHIYIQFTTKLAKLGWMRIANSQSSQYTLPKEKQASKPRQLFPHCQ